MTEKKTDKKEPTFEQALERVETIVKEMEAGELNLEQMMAHFEEGMKILLAIAKHHHGEYGFLTEGVDWNNHVGAEHHFNGAEFGDIKYTEPLLNNLHIVEPTLLALKLENAVK